MGALPDPQPTAHPVIAARGRGRPAQSAVMRERVRRLIAWFLGTFATLLERLASVGLIYSGVVLAAQTLMALLPLLIVVIALLPTWAGASLAQNLRDRLGI